VVSCLEEAGVCLANLPARMRTGDARPVVGDWVVLQGDGEGCRVEHILERRTCFVRRASGRRKERQLVAANVDVVFIVSALDRDFNPRRLERYLAAVGESGARPVVLLTKAALVDAETRATFVEQAEAVCPGVGVHAIDVLAELDADVPSRYRTPGSTTAVVGSSGVGKSTLVNAWIGEARQLTAGVRARDQRGQHTTTHRELFALPDGSWVIDTPGMRELGLWGTGESLEEAFPEIDELAQGCRFGDCRHEQEPDCSVREAVAAGVLPAVRLVSFRVLRDELEEGEPADRRARGRVGRPPREAPKAKRR